MAVAIVLSGLAVLLPEAAAQEKASSRGARALAEADRIVARGVTSGAFPGAALAVGRSSGLVHLRSFGRFSYEASSLPVEANTLYDLASLTKVVAATPVAMSLQDDGLLDLDAPVGTYLPCFVGGARDRVRVWHLLAHASGLPDWVALYREVRDKEAVIERLCQMELESDPGTTTAYGDLGMILLGVVLERAGGASFDALAQERVFAPLAMDDTLFRPGPEMLLRIAPTEREAWRGRLLRGEVHDANSYVMGGVSAHAGLFSTAGDVSRFSQMMLAGGVLEGRRFARRETVERFTRRVDVRGSTRALGWETPAGDPWAGRLWSQRAYGHTGLTGTVLWIDPGQDLYLVLLTNRIHPTRENEKWRDVRRELSDAVIRAMQAVR